MAEPIIAASQDIETPAYIADVAKLKRNLATAARIKKESGCKILLATKAFALPAIFPLMRDTLDGTTASGLYEARLGREEFGKEVHAYAPAYKPSEFADLTRFADHIYFNSPSEMSLYLPQVKAAGKKTGVRINPGYSNATLGGDLYNPCAPCSRFGTLPADLPGLPWGDIEVLHAHVLCESMHEGSVSLIEHIAKNFGDYVKKVKVVNFGGGHFFNKPGYNVDALIAAIKNFRSQFPHVQVVLEPGGALAYDAGYVVSSVLAIHHNDKDIAILDTSASCHMPDVLEVPFTPPLLGAAEMGAHAHGYIITGRTCMTGDVIGEYSFPLPLKPGSRVVFGDGLQYSFIKNNTFNGTPLPNLGVLDESGKIQMVSDFGYDDFRMRLGKQSQTDQKKHPH